MWCIIRPDTDFGRCFADHFLGGVARQAHEPLADLDVPTVRQAAQSDRIGARVNHFFVLFLGMAQLSFDSTAFRYVSQNAREDVFAVADVLAKRNLQRNFCSALV